MAYPGPGTFPGATTFPGAATFPGDVSVTLTGGGAITVDTLTLPTIVTLNGVTLTGGGAIEVTDARPVVPLTDVTLRGGGTISARPDEQTSPDPRTPQRPQWRYVVTDLAGVPLGELCRIAHDPVDDGVNTPGTMSFAIAATDPARALLVPIERQLQVWDGTRLVLRGPILPGRVEDGGTTITFGVHDPSWWWRGGRRVIGRVPKRNLIRNGDFTRGLTYWPRGYDKGSIPAAAPTVQVVNDDFTDGGKAASIVGVQSVTQTKSSLESAAIYWPNRPFAWEPLAKGFRPGGGAKIDAVAKAMPTTAGLKVTIIGHTANDGTGNGLKLSLRRAQAAAARVKALRPGATITTKGVGFYDPDPKHPVDSQAQRRVEIIYDHTETISGKSRQWIKQQVVVTQPKAAAYPLPVTAAAWLKIMKDWTVEDANMTSVRITAARQATPGKIWAESSTSVSDTDPINRWMKQSATIDIPPDGRPYVVTIYLYAPAALARWTRAGIWPAEALWFWGKDQADIVRGIGEHIQDAGTGKGPLGLTFRTPRTGVVRDRLYPFHERMPAETALEEFAGLYRGMDLDVICTPTKTTLATFYPRQGKRVDVALVLGGNLVKAVPANTRDVGTSIIAQADGGGVDRDEAYAADRPAFGGLMLERVISAEGETPINELDEVADAELVAARVTTPAWWVDVHPDRVAEVTATVGKGDTVRLVLDGTVPVDGPARVVRRQQAPGLLRLMLALEV